jgi:hypothetical protein
MEIVAHMLLSCMFQNGADGGPNIQDYLLKEVTSMLAHRKKLADRYQRLETEVTSLEKLSTPEKDKENYPARREGPPSVEAQKPVNKLGCRLQGSPKSPKRSPRKKGESPDRNSSSQDKGDKSEDASPDVKVKSLNTNTLVESLVQAHGPINGRLPSFNITEKDGLNHHGGKADTKKSELNQTASKAAPNTTYSSKKQKLSDTDSKEISSPGKSSLEGDKSRFGIMSIPVKIPLGDVGVKPRLPVSIPLASVHEEILSKAKSDSKGNKGSVDEVRPPTQHMLTGAGLSPISRPSSTSSTASVTSVKGMHHYHQHPAGPPTQRLHNLDGVTDSSSSGAQALKVMSTTVTSGHTETPQQLAKEYNNRLLAKAMLAGNAGPNIQANPRNILQQATGAASGKNQGQSTGAGQDHYGTIDYNALSDLALSSSAQAAAAAAGSSPDQTKGKKGRRKRTKSCSGGEAAKRALHSNSPSVTAGSAPQGQIQTETGTSAKTSAQPPSSDGVRVIHHPMPMSSVHHTKSSHMVGSNKAVSDLVSQGMFINNLHFLIDIWFKHFIFKLVITHTLYSNLVFYIIF